MAIFTDENSGPVILPDKPLTRRGEPLPLFVQHPHGADRAVIVVHDRAAEKSWLVGAGQRRWFRWADDQWVSE